jgi:putative transcriptional regulator
MMEHHPHSETLMDYAAGNLPWPHATVLAAHLRLCPACRAASGQLMAVGGALMQELTPAPLGARALQDTLARLDQPLPPQPLLVPTLAGLATKRWRWLGPGMALMPLAPRDDTGTRLDLIRVAPGMAMPEHGHSGNEMTCVLQGAFSDAAGTYRVGDLVQADSAIEHQPTAMAGADCICLSATTGRLHAHNRFVRIIQSLLDI